MKLAVQIAAGIVMAAGLLSGSSMAGPPLPTASPEQHGQPELEVTVEAQRQRKRIEREIQTFVTSLVLPRQDESLARWQVPICPVVAGMTPEQGEFVRKLIRATKPIRVWYNVMSVCPYGRATYEIQGSEDGSRAYIRCIDGDMGSKLRWVTVRKIVSAIVVADSALIEERTIGQLADYIAMIGLAQLRRNVETGSVPTILRLFADAAPKATQHLSRWDEAFLRSLYATDVESVVQLKAMQARMYGDLVR